MVGGSKYIRAPRLKDKWRPPLQVRCTGQNRIHVILQTGSRRLSPFARFQVAIAASRVCQGKATGGMQGKSSLLQGARVPCLGAEL